MEWFVWGLVALVFVSLVLVEGMNFAASGLSVAELERRVAGGDKAAKKELARRRLMPVYFGVKRLKSYVLAFATVGLLAIIYDFWLALPIGLLLVLLAYFMVARGWFNWLVRWLQPKVEGRVFGAIAAGEPLFKLFAQRGDDSNEATFASSEELKNMVQKDPAVLTTDQKARLLAALNLDGKKVSDVMVPADKIATVNQSETVGPLLLDRLHKTGHNIIVVVSKSLDSVKGLLYMSDLVPLDPEIKTVKDALRSKVFYIQADAPLGDVLAASVKTGRQLFLVAKEGKTVGLVTLADSLEHVLGDRPSKAVEVSTKP